MAEYTAIAEQTVSYLQPVIWTETTVPCTRGLIRHEDGSGVITLSGAVSPSELQNRCCCQGQPSADYLVVCHANIAIPEEVAVGEIRLALAMDGVVIPASIMKATPTVVNAYFNVGTSKNLQVFMGCCEKLSVLNATVAQTDILVSNAVIDITRPDLVMTM